MFKPVKITLTFMVFFIYIYAQEFKSYGSKSLGMGGVGVANSRDSFANHYNPALIGVNEFHTSMSLGASAQLSENGFLDSIQRIEDLKLYEVLEDLDNELPTIILEKESNGALKLEDGVPVLKMTGTADENIMDKLNTGIEIINNLRTKHLELVLSPYANLQIARSLSVGLYSEVVVEFTMTTNPEADTIIIKNTNLDETIADLIKELDSLSVSADDTEAKLRQTLEEKYSYLKLGKDGVFDFSNENEYKEKSIENALIGDDPSLQAKVVMTQIYQIPISYATSFKPFDTKDDIRVGGSLKYINARFAGIKTKLIDIEDISLPEFQSKSGFGIDIGGLYTLNRDDFSDGLALGVVLKNLNSPAFKFDDEKVKLDMQARIGMSYPMFFDVLEFALDYDITDNDHTTSQFTSKYLSYGLNIKPASWIGIRAGIKQNLGKTPITDKPIVTAGLNFGLKWLQLELAGGMSSAKNTFKDENGVDKELPVYLEGTLAFTSKWGSTYERKKAPKSQDKQGKQISKEVKKVKTQRDDAFKAQKLKAEKELDASIKALKQ